MYKMLRVRRDALWCGTHILLTQDDLAISCVFHLRGVLILLLCRVIMMGCMGQYIDIHFN